jgi:hypothetical protein
MEEEHDIEEARGDLSMHLLGLGLSLLLMIHLRGAVLWSSQYVLLKYLSVRPFSTAKTSTPSSFPK